jgi:hypothetical protein
MTKTFATRINLAKSIEEKQARLNHRVLELAQNKLEGRQCRGIQ